MNTTNNTTNNEENKKEETVVYTDAMLPDSSQEDIDNAESVHCKSWYYSCKRTLGCFNWTKAMPRPSGDWRRLHEMLASKNIQFSLEASHAHL